MEESEVVGGIKAGLSDLVGDVGGRERGKREQSALNVMVGE